MKDELRASEAAAVAFPREFDGENGDKAELDPSRVPGFERTRIGPTA